MPITIGILGGSFNPVHVGHMMLASYLAQWGYVDKVWLTLSPQNPLKEAGSLIPDTKRLEMLKIALQGSPNLDICDLELTMPTPSYTINTLDTLASRYQNRHFKLIIGSDNWAIFERWRSYQRILDEYGVIVYPRPGYPIENKSVDGMEVVEAPTADISSTFIRKALTRGRDIRYFVPAGVDKYIAQQGLYSKEF